MIILRYLSKQVITTSVVVVALLTMIMMGGRLIKYFGVAAQGRLDASILFSIIGYRLPEFLTLILPLGFFIGIMLVFGRLYVDHEMAVFNSSGVSRWQLTKKILPLTIGVLIVQAMLMMFISPWGNTRFDQLTTEQAIRTGFDLVRPKEFISSGPYTIYADSLSDDRRSLKGVFFYQKAKEQGKPDSIIVAESAKRIVVEGDTANIVDLYKGRRYSFIPGQAKYLQAEFENYRLRLENNNEKSITQRVEAMPMAKLINNQFSSRPNPVMSSELGWRVFGPWVILLALFLAVPLSEVSPRQGRYYKLFPAIMIFASLIVAMMAVKTRVSKDELSIFAYPIVLLIYVVLIAFFSRKSKLTAKIKS